MNWDLAIHILTGCLISSVVYMVGKEFKGLRAEVISFKCQMSRVGEQLYTVENRLSNLNGFSKEAWDLMNENKEQLKLVVEELPKFELVDKQYEKFKKEIREHKAILKKKSDAVIKRMDEVGNKAHLIDEQYHKSAKWVADIARDFHTLASKIKSGEIQHMSILSEKAYLQLRNIDK